MIHTFNFIVGNVTESRTMNTLTRMVAISSSVTVFLTASIVIFINGLACGHCFNQKYKHPSTTSKETPHTTDQPPSSTTRNTEPLYDYILTSTEKHWEQGHELKENIAYGQSE